MKASLIGISILLTISMNLKILSTKEEKLSLVSVLKGKTCD
jgi:hypothetical protein